jgi:hypothetical protein
MHVIFIYMRMFPRVSVCPTMGVMVGVVIVWYQSQGFNTERRWAGRVVFGPKVWSEIVS